MLHDIDHFNEQKKKKRISLNEEKFMAERAELNAEKQEEKEFDELNDPNRPGRQARLLLQRSAGDHRPTTCGCSSAPQAAAVGSGDRAAAG